MRQFVDLKRVMKQANLCVVFSGLTAHPDIREAFVREGVMLSDDARRDFAEHTFFQIERAALPRLRPGSSFLLSCAAVP